jgi:hypothetical protein
MTLGETRVRTKFNPSDLDNVSLIKQKTAELINLLQEERSKSPSTFIQGSEEESKHQEINFNSPDGIRDSSYVCCKGLYCLR